MKVKYLLIKPEFEDSYLVIGYTSDIIKPPAFWQLPIIPNEYGEYNLNKVVKKNLVDNYGLKMTKIVDHPSESNLVFIEVENNKIKYPAVLIDTDGQDTIEFRRFVNKETLNNYIDSQDSMFGNLYL